MWKTLGMPHNPVLVPVPFSYHSDPKTPHSNTPKQEQDLRKRKGKKSAPFSIVPGFKIVCNLLPEANENEVCFLLFVSGIFFFL